VEVFAVAFYGYAVLIVALAPFEKKGMRGGGAYVATGNNLVYQHNVLGVPAVEAVGVDGTVSRGACSVHIQVCHCDVLGVGDECMPSILLASHSKLHQHHGEEHTKTDSATT
jgi:hypothetical protein